MGAQCPSQSKELKALARKKINLEIKLHSILKQAALHTMFLIALSLIVSGNMSWQTYLQNEELRNIFLRNTYIEKVINNANVM